MRPILRIAIGLVGFWLLLCGLAFVLQRRFQYFPDRGPVPLPPDDRWQGLEAVTFEAADGIKLEAFFWPGVREETLLVLHGNAGHRGHRLDWMEGFHRRGWSVFLLDWRGYGGSEGSPSEEGFLQDAEAAAAWLAGRKRTRVIYVGESIGCGVAVELAARRPPLGLVLQSGTISVARVAQRAYPFLPMGLLLKDRFDVAGTADQVHCPSLSIHGDLDEIVPLELGRALHDALGGPGTWYVIEGAEHNDIVAWGGEAYYARVHAFLEEVSR